MAHVKYYAYLNSPEWAARRKVEFAKAKGACAGCGRRPQNIHHRTYARLGHEAEDDLVALCKHCHLLAHLHHVEHPDWGLWEATNAAIREQRKLFGLPAIPLPRAKGTRKAVTKTAQPKRRSERRTQRRQARREAFFADPARGLTLAEIEAARTPAGGWTRKQLTAWGVPWPPPKGWKEHLAKHQD